MSKTKLRQLIKKLNTWNEEQFLFTKKQDMRERNKKSIDNIIYYLEKYNINDSVYEDFGKFIRYEKPKKTIRNVIGSIEDYLIKFDCEYKKACDKINNLFCDCNEFEYKHFYTITKCDNTTGKVISVATKFNNKSQPIDTLLLHLDSSSLENLKEYNNNEKNISQLWNALNPYEWENTTLYI